MPDVCPIFVNGDWRELRNIETSPVHNPSTGEVIALTPMCTAAHVNDAVQAAAAAFPAVVGNAAGGARARSLPFQNAT